MDKSGQESRCANLTKGEGNTWRSPRRGTRPVTSARSDAQGEGGMEQGRGAPIPTLVREPRCPTKRHALGLTVRPDGQGEGREESETERRVRW